MPPPRPSRSSGSTSTARASRPSSCSHAASWPRGRSSETGSPARVQGARASCPRPGRSSGAGCRRPRRPRPEARRAPRSRSAACRRPAAPGRGRPSGAAATARIRRAPLEIMKQPRRGPRLASRPGPVQVLVLDAPPRAAPGRGSWPFPCRSRCRAGSIAAVRARSNRSSALLGSRQAASPTDTRRGCALPARFELDGAQPCRGPGGRPPPPAASPRPGSTISSSPCAGPADAVEAPQRGLQGRGHVGEHLLAQLERRARAPSPRGSRPRPAGSSGGCCGVRPARSPHPAARTSCWPDRHRAALADAPSGCGLSKLAAMPWSLTSVGARRSVDASTQQTLCAPRAPEASARPRSVQR